MSVFSVRYFKNGKEKGAQRFLSHRLRTYEEVLFKNLINDLCRSVYQTDYWWQFLNCDIFIKRVRVNAKLCLYDVTMFDLRDKTKLLAEYQVEINCELNDGLHDIFEQEEELMPLAQRKIEKPIKKPFPTEWLMKESRAVRWFLMQLSEAKSLKNLRRTTLMSKATYHRNLKICREKGYIQGDKLVKRIFVRKIA